MPATGVRGSAPTVWLTGLSGAGKSTIARAAVAELVNEGISAYVLDGDALRAGLSADLGFSLEDRAEQVRRAGQVARILGDAGVVAFAALISPTRAERDIVRAMHPAGRFIEVHVATSMQVCEARDVKGLYARARAGQISDFTGIDSPYEAPIAADVVLDGSAELGPQVQELCEAVRARLSPG
jgi:adenylylsulfate kinase